MCSKSRSIATSAVDPVVQLKRRQIVRGRSVCVADLGV